MTGDSTAGAQAGRNAVENNWLSVEEADRKAVLERREKAGTITPEERQELSGINQTDKARDQAIHDICTQGNKGNAACGALIGPAQEALKKYGEKVTYSLLYTDLYPRDAKSIESVLKGLDAGSISRDQAITAIANATGKDWSTVAKQYDTALQAQAIVGALAGMKGIGVADKGVFSKETSPKHNVNTQTKSEPVKLGTKIDNSLVLTDKEKLPDSIASTFKTSNYETVVTREPVTLYRKFGGSESQAKLDGGYATTTANASRNETAVYKKWSATQFEAQIEIPKDTKLNVGFVAEQPPLSNAPKYDGGADQILLPRNYPVEWIKSVRDGKTGKVYTYDEFKREFPEQVTRGK